MESSGSFLKKSLGRGNQNGVYSSLKICCWCEKQNFSSRRFKKKLFYFFFTLCQNYVVSPGSISFFDLMIRNCPFFQGGKRVVCRNNFSRGFDKGS